MVEMIPIISCRLIARILRESGCGIKLTEIQTVYYSAKHIADFLRSQGFRVGKFEFRGLVDNYYDRISTIGAMCYVYCTIKRFKKLKRHNSNLIKKFENIRRLEPFGVNFFGQKIKIIKPIKLFKKMIKKNEIKIEQSNNKNILAWSDGEPCIVPRLLKKYLPC